MTNEWIKHDGGECPVPPDARVDVRYCNGGDSATYLDTVACLGMKKGWIWEKKECQAWEISHYRLVRTTEELLNDAAKFISNPNLIVTEGYGYKWTMNLVEELSAKLREREVYLVWSNEHNSWWRANSGGYTSYVESAGEYTKEEALSICNGANYDWNTDRLKKIPDELPILKSIALELNYSTTPPKKETDNANR